VEIYIAVIQKHWAGGEKGAIKIAKSYAL